MENLRVINESKWSDNTKYTDATSRPSEAVKK